MFEHYSELGLAGLGVLAVIWLAAVLAGGLIVLVLKLWRWRAGTSK